MTFRSEEIFMCAHFRYFAILNVQDPVRLSNSGKAMGNYKAGPIFHQVFHTLLDESLGDCIDRAGGFVHDE